jgi:hypothetical protein
VASVSFFHPMIQPDPHLHIGTGVDEVTWGYALNTMAYPTYGGEVVQILSCFIDDLEIVGTTHNYAKQEQIYSYFAYYLQIATQGRAQNKNPGVNSYNQEPMIFTYPERDWQFEIIVKGLPGFRQGTEVVAPAWRIQAHIVDHSQDVDRLKDFTKSTLLDRLLKKDGGQFDLEGRIGFQASNPFSSPGSIFGDSFDPTYTREAWRKESDRFSEVINGYLDADLDEVYDTLASRPSYGTNGAEGGKTPKSGRDTVEKAKGRNG